MKVEVEELEAFTPISVTFKVENEHELNAITEMAFWNDSIPNVCNEKYRPEIKEFLSSLNRELFKSKTNIK